MLIYDSFDDFNQVLKKILNWFKRILVRFSGVLTNISEFTCDFCSFVKWEFWNTALNRGPHYPNSMGRGSLSLYSMLANILKQNSCKKSTLKLWKTGETSYLSPILSGCQTLGPMRLNISMFSIKVRSVPEFYFANYF